MNKSTKLFQSIAIAFAALLFFSVGCNRNKGESNIAKAKLACFQSVYERDTMWMQVDTGKQFIEGNMSIHYWSKNQKYVGTFRGEMLGDTLIGNFNFKINELPTSYSNPVAFLKKDGKYIMGDGKFETLLGRVYFSKATPIDYSNSMFELVPVACKED